MLVNPKFKYRGVWLMVGCMLVLAVVYLSITSTPVQFNIGVDWQDKLYHMLAYFVLMFWFVQLYHDRKQMLMIAVLLVSMGIMMEVIQSFDPMRYADYEDMLANTAGVVIAVFMARTWMRNLLFKFERSLF